MNGDEDTYVERTLVAVLVVVGLEPFLASFTGPDGPVNELEWFQDANMSMLNRH